MLAYSGIQGNMPSYRNYLLNISIKILVFLGYF